jgi:hypothetical protein
VLFRAESLTACDTHLTRALRARPLPPQWAGGEGSSGLLTFLELALMGQLGEMRL